VAVKGGAFQDFLAIAVKLVTDTILIVGLQSLTSLPGICVSDSEKSGGLLALWPGDFTPLLLLATKTLFWQEMSKKVERKYRRA
jgi:hypothetical protein